MAESSTATGKTLELFAEIAKYGVQGLYRRLAPKARLYLKCLLCTSIAALVIIPALGVLKAVTGYVGFGYMMALLAILFTLALGIMWAPISLSLGTLLEETHSLKIVGEKYIKFVAMILFFELVAAMYISYIPLDRQPDSVPIFFIAVVVLILGSAIWGGWLSGRFYTFIAMLMVIKISLSAFFPQTATVVTTWWKQLDGKIAQGCNAPTVSERTPMRSPEVRPVPRQQTALQKISPVPASTNQNQSSTKIVRVDVTPNSWTKVSLPQHTKFECVLAGWAEFLLPDSSVTYVDGSKKLSLNHSGPTDFQIRGTEGVAVFTLQ